MPLIKLCLSSALLLLVLTCPLWQVGQSVPVMGKGPMTDLCVLQARTLLHNITDTLTKNNLFRGFNCERQSVEMNTETDTASVCAPKESKCTEIVKTEFDQGSCLKNIEEDLAHYYKFLSAQPDPNGEITPTVLSSLGELMENCFAWSLPAALASGEAASDRPSTYDERLSLCKVLKGFQVRAITINRVIGYMNSGEHTK